ncbi:glycosyl hydrolase, partial [Bacteroidota bacterium]
MKKIFIIGLFAIALGSCNQEESKTSSINPKDKEIANKVETLLGKMTLEEKVTEMIQDAPANERLGIPVMKYGEALH